MSAEPVPARDVSAALPLSGAAKRLRRPPGRPRKAEGSPAPASALARIDLSARLLDLSDTARYIGVSEWTVRDLVDAGTLRRVRIPLPRGGEIRKLLFDRVDLDALIEEWKEATR